MIFLEAEIIVH